MYYKIAPYILKNRKILIPLVLIGLFINLFLSKLIFQNLDELFEKSTIITLLLENIACFVMYFVVIGWCTVSKNWKIYEADSALVPFAIIILIILLVISIPLVWVEKTYELINFPLAWVTVFFAIMAESKNLDEYFDSPKSNRVVVFHNDVTIENEIVIFTTSSRKKEINILDIKRLDVKISAKNSFEVLIHSDRVYTYFVNYSEKNIQSLSELVQVCPSSQISSDDFDAIIKDYNANLKQAKHPLFQ